MLPDRVSNPGPLTYEPGALPTALRGPAPNGKRHFDTVDILGSKMTGKSQELIQSNPTSNPKNPKGKNHTHKLINVHERHAR